MHTNSHALYTIHNPYLNQILLPTTRYKFSSTPPPVTRTPAVGSFLPHRALSLLFLKHYCPIPPQRNPPHNSLQMHTASFHLTGTYYLRTNKLNKALPSTSYQHPGHHFYSHTTHFPSSSKNTHPNLPLNNSPSSSLTFIPALEPPHTSSSSYNSSTSHRQDHVLLNATVLASFTKTSPRSVTLFGSMSSPA